MGVLVSVSQPGRSAGHADRRRAGRARLADRGPQLHRLRVSQRHRECQRPQSLAPVDTAGPRGPARRDRLFPGGSRGRVLDAAAAGQRRMARIRPYARGVRNANPARNGAPQHPRRKSAVARWHGLRGTPAGAGRRSSTGQGGTRERARARGGRPARRRPRGRRSRRQRITDQACTGPPRRRSRGRSAARGLCAAHVRSAECAAVRGERGAAVGAGCSARGRCGR